MAALETTLFPLVEMHPVADTHNAWAALSVRLTAIDGDLGAGLQTLFGSTDLLNAVAPLDLIITLDTPEALNASLMTLLPPNRILFAMNAAALGDETSRKRIQSLHDDGYRMLIDGPLPEGVAGIPTLRSIACDCSAGVPASLGGKFSLAAMFGPHLARGVDTWQRRSECGAAGFTWFSGAWPLQHAPAHGQHDGTTRKRLLTLLGLLARDAESRELEALLKQDPALSFQLLKLVNSAAFAMSTPITSFVQAIGLLGRRQLQRWLQLLLYARQQADGLPNPLLPLAALRAAQLEALTKAQGGDRDEQDQAFMTGVFSLLDVLLEMPMSEIVGALNLATEASDALLTRDGRLGQLLHMVESGDPRLSMLDESAVEPEHWWQSQLHAYHWAIQVSRNL